MPGHSLRFVRGRWRVFHGSSFLNTENSLQDLHDQFRVLGSKNKPREYQFNGSGNDPDIKFILLLEAGILEALQRWQVTTPNPVYIPNEDYDYDQITELLNQLNIELASHPNDDGTVSPAYNPQPLPRSWQANPDDVSAEYDTWVVARLEEFRDELVNKPDVTQVANPRKSTDQIKYAGALLDQMLAMLPAYP